jgi:hypothetical protein
VEQPVGHAGIGDAMIDRTPQYRYVAFPGLAGKLQQQADLVGLISEVGDNYDRYHAFLASALNNLGGRPDAADFQDDYAGYCRACDTLMELLNAEMFLRRCYSVRQLGIGFDEAVNKGLPIVDEWHRLVSFTQKTALAPKLARNDPERWVPAPLADAANPAARATHG